MKKPTKSNKNITSNVSLQEVMATRSDRSWLFQTIAHNANVNCVALGRKSGMVMVTGGDDMKVNLWAIGKSSCFMNLSGHTTPVDCVHFNHSEELVLSGSRTGALKVWDLEAASLVRTLTGHRDAIRCMDFHPYGEYLASGSTDCAIKVWDSRRKGCICTFTGHTEKVNSIKFSPDGHWIASGSDDHTIKLWDMRIGKMLKEFKDHSCAVTTVEFHPHEFLLASGGSDSIVNYFDLENFNLVSSERNLGLVRCMCFNPDGECLFVGVRDYLKVLGWEPSRLYDSVSVSWGRIFDISTAQHQLIGASFHLTKVYVHVAELKLIKPFGGSTPETPTSFTPNTSLRKSFSRAERPVSLRNHLDVKTIEESTSGTDPEEESTAAITNRTDYEEIFRPGRSLNRTPPPPLEPDSFVDTEEEHQLNGVVDVTAPQILENLEASSLDHNVNYSRGSPPRSPPRSPPNTAYARSKSNLDQAYSNRNSKHDNRENATNKQKSLQPPKFNLHRQSSCKESNVDNKLKHNISNNIKHSVSEINLNKNLNAIAPRNNLRKNSFSKSTTQTGNLHSSLSKIPMTSRQHDKPMNILNSEPVDIYVKSNKISPDDNIRSKDFIPVSIDRPVGLQLDDFLPKNIDSFTNQLPSNMSDAEVLNVVMGGHNSMLTLLKTRSWHLQLVIKQFHDRDVKTAVEIAINVNNPAVIVDLLGVINSKHSLWNLDLCVLLLPKIEELIQSKYESYMTTACDSLRLILRHFGPVIKTNTQCPVGSYGVDIPREERYRKTSKCYEYLEGIRLVIYKKQSYPDKVGNAFKEVYTLMQNTLD